MDINLTGYLLMMAGGALLCVLWFFAAFRRQAGTRKAAALSGLILLLGIVLGVICARLSWILMRFNAFQARDLFSLRYDELSYFGGIAGVILAVWLSAKITGQSGRTVLNAFAPMGALMAAVARFAEVFLGEYGVGYVEEWFEKGLFFPVTIGIAWDEYESEYYLAVFMLSGIFCLIAMIVSLFRSKEHNRLTRTLFYICLPQILLESLRMMSINWLFVRVEMLLCFLFCEAVLVFYAVKANPKKLRSWIPAITGLLVCGIVIVGEFTLDGKITLGGQYISKWIVYGVEIAGLAAIAIAENRGYRRMNNEY